MNIRMVYLLPLFAVVACSHDSIDVSSLISLLEPILKVFVPSPFAGMIVAGLSAVLGWWLKKGHAQIQLSKKLKQ